MKISIGKQMIFVREDTISILQKKMSVLESYPRRIEENACLDQLMQRRMEMIRELSLNKKIQERDITVHDT